MAIEDMDWSWMTEDYICFTEDFDADRQLAEHCDGQGDEDDDEDSDDNSLTLILGVVGAVVVVGIAIMIVVMKRRKPTKPPSEAAPPVHEPTAPPQLASIKAEALGMMSEEPPLTAEPIAEAITVPHGHITGAEAAALMAEGEPPPQPSEGWGARTLQRLASWRAVEEPPPPPAAEAYAPEPELEPEC